MEENCYQEGLSSLAVCPDPQQIVINGAANVEPRERPWLSEFGITVFAIAVRTHGEDGEGRTLAAILFSSLATKDVALGRKFSNNVVLARAVLIVI